MNNEEREREYIPFDPDEVDVIPLCTGTGCGKKQYIDEGCIPRQVGQSYRVMCADCADIARAIRPQRRATRPPISLSRGGSE